MDFELEGIRSLRALFEKRDIPGLKSFASEAARDALVRSDASLVDLSVLAYSLAKLAEKPYIINSPDWKRLAESVSAALREAEDLEAKGDAVAARERVHEALNAIDSLSLELGRFVSSIVEKGRLKAAAQMYAHGASLGTAAEFTGASKQELASYVGETKIPDKYEAMRVEERLEKARRVLGQ